jgi:hypothetical protein
LNAPSLTPKNDGSTPAPRESIGKRIYSYLLDPEVKGNLQGPIESFVAVLILLNVGLMLLETIPQIYEPYAKLFHTIDTISIYIFTLEYVVRFALAPHQRDLQGKRFPRLSYAKSPFAVIDLLSILPFYLSAFIALDLRVLRVLRLLRLLKLFRILIPAWKEFRQLNEGRTFRQHVHAIVWPSRFGGQINQFCDLFIIFWVLISVLSVLLETVGSVHYILAMEFAVLDSVAVAIFTTEYLMRIYSCVEDPKFKSRYLGRARYSLTPGAVIDLLAVLPFFLEALLHHLFDLRFLRIFRMLRLLKLTRFSDATKLVWDGIKREAGTIGASFFVMLLVIILCGALGYMFEHAAQPEKFESIPTSIYWSVITLGSVGFGDISPVTPMGRFLASLMALLGIALIAIPSGILAAAFTDQLRMEREAIGNKIAAMMEDDNIDADEKAHLESDARRLHITHTELDEMIAVAQRRRMEDQALRTEFNLSAASLDPQLAFEQFRGILESMRKIIDASDEKLGQFIARTQTVTHLEKMIYEKVVSERNGSGRV